MRELGPERPLARRADLAASFQRAVVEALMLKVEQALDATGARRLAIGGGVAANSELRARLGALCADRGLELKIPPPELCTDNAAMIASAARFLEPVPYPASSPSTPSRAAPPDAQRIGWRGSRRPIPMPTVTLYTKPTAAVRRGAQAVLERVRERSRSSSRWSTSAPTRSWPRATASASRSCRGR